MTPGDILVPGKPKLRSDIVITRHEDATNAPFVAKDPRTTQFFRFREAEHFIVSQLDGETPLDVVRQRTEARFAATLSHETLTQFVRTLQDHGLLETDRSRRESRSRSRVKGSLLYLRCKVFDPDRLLTRMAKPLAPLFSMPFLVLSLLLIAVASATVMSNTAELGHSFVRHFSLSWFLVAWGFIIVVGAIHELAHGLACKRFGGEVHEIGIFFIYFNPAFYCDVSDAWLFPQKSKRLLVTLAGPYLELVFWALATLVWRVTNHGTLPNSLALIVMATSGFKVFFNLNPLLKFDGYYLLSDWLGIPNLRQKSFEYLRGLLSRRGDRPTEPTALTRRERTIYFVYGVLAFVYSFAMLWFVAVRLGGKLIPQYHEWGLLLFLLLFGARVRNRLRSRMFKGTSTLQPARDPAGEAAKTAPRRRTRLVALAVLAAAVVASFFVKIDLRLGGEVRVLPARNAEVRSEVEGLIAEVHVREGMKVQQGDLVARLSDRDLAAELRKAEAEIAEKQATLRMLRIGTRPEEIAVAQKEVATAEARAAYSARRYDEATRMRAEKLAQQEAGLSNAEQLLKYKRSTLERMQALRGLQLVSLKEIEQAEEDAAVKQKELDDARGALQITRADDLASVRKELALATTGVAEAKSKLAKLLAGSRREEIEAQEATIVRLEAQKRLLEEQLRLTEIKSPIAGIVVTPERQLLDLIGQHVNKGDLLAAVNRLDTVTAEIALSERDVGDVATGQRVAVKARAYPDMTFEGTVTSVAAAVQTGGASPDGKASPSKTPVPVEAGGDRVVLVTTEIENGSLLLKPEMTGRAKISCGDQPIFHVLTRRLARVIRVEFWSWW